MGLFGPLEDRDSDYKGMADALINHIENLVASETWTDTGGAVGMIRESDGRLLIRQTAEAHGKINAFLTALRRPSWSSLTSP